MEATVERVSQADKVWYRVYVYQTLGHVLAEFRYEEDAQAWCRLWNAADDPNSVLNETVDELERSVNRMQAKIQCDCGATFVIHMSETNRDWDSIRGMTQHWETAHCPDCDVEYELNRFTPEGDQDA